MEPRSRLAMLWDSVAACFDCCLQGVFQRKLARARARNAQTQDWMQAAMCAESI